MCATRRITRIEPQKHDGARVNVYLDDSFAFGLDGAVLQRLGLNEGDEIDEERVEKILLVEEGAKTKAKALSLLSHRAYGTAELKKKLRDKGFSEMMIERAAEDFTRVGLLDDVKFSEAFVQTRMIHRPAGKRVLRRELLMKGIAQEVAERAVDHEYGTESEAEVARRLAEKRMRQDGERTMKMKKRLADFLARRGFGWEVIQEVLERWEWGAEG